MTDVSEFVQHSSGCPVDPARIETIDHGEIVTARCLSCAGHFPPHDPAAVTGGMSTADSVANYRAALADAQARVHAETEGPRR
jgi:hypothetical protein